ncbi:GTPase HflX [candidate division KSB1 bacterium]|nr:GTPase HflX [candidate division KSB1 bacterium]
MYEVNSSAKEKAILVGVIKKGTDRWETADHLEELALLTDTAGAVVADKVIQEKEKIDPAFYVGRGKAENLSELAQKRSADLIIFDDDLSPAQIRNLERLSDKKILDRSGLILDIFASRAKTREAKTQVELAQLKYLLPRLTRQWTHLSRQVGGIGTRGPGETQLEVDRRLIGKRISKLSEDLVKIKNQRDVRRRGRELTTQVALVGYTNAGKSTLLNALTDSKVFVEDRLFATLDSTIRRMKADNHSDLLLIDTVGFIRKLPHNLVASFMSTLEEANKADVLLHVVDISHSLVFKQISVVKDVLNELKILNKPTIYVFNKIDKLEQKGLVERFKNEYEHSVFISATKGMFLEDLKKEIVKMSSEAIVDLEVTIDISDSEMVSKIHSLAEVSDSDYNENTVILNVRATPENAHKIKWLLNGRGEWARIKFLH